MLRQLLILSILAVLIICFSRYFSALLHFFLGIHHQFSDFLKQIFSSGNLGTFMRRLVSLVLIPIVAGAVPAGVYFAFQRKKFPWMMHIVWIAFIILATSLLYKG